jgi:hypothetical protein
MSSLIPEHNGSPNGDYSSIELNEQSHSSYQHTEEPNEETPILSGNHGKKEKQRTWCSCITCYLCCCSTANDSRDQRVAFCWLSLINLLLLIALAGGGYYYKTQSDARFSKFQYHFNEYKQTTDDDYLKLLQKFSDFKSAENSFERKMQKNWDTNEHVLFSIEASLNNQQKQLTRLSNGTSNADVLDQIKKTREDVRKSLDKQQSVVFAKLSETNQNVTANLMRSSLAWTETNAKVKSELGNTIAHMNDVVGVAAVHIQQVQRNVTKEMEVMTDRIEAYVHNLGIEVQEAEDLIHKEVSVVQGNIEQYVSITNKQFAAENDFVKYQLAGLQIKFKPSHLFFSSFS